jgi:single-stranded DNA-binding protein
MANSINTVVIMGRLAEAPELREYNEGRMAVVHARVMTNYSKRNSEFDENRPEGDDNKQWIDVPEGHDVEIWNHQARYVSKYAVKGQQIAVTGRA